MRYSIKIRYRSYFYLKEDRDNLYYNVKANNRYY